MTVIVQLAVLLTIAVNCNLAQELKPVVVPIRPFPSIPPPPPPPPACSLSVAANTADIARRLNSGALKAAPAAAAASSVAVSTFRCENGPKRVIHTVPKEFHFPPIYRGTCNRLFCKDPPCIARRTRWVTKCVHVFKLTPWGWVYAGRQLRRFLDHLECGCKKCSDIFSRIQCTNTKPCPNSLNKNSFCYWTPFILPTIRPPLTIRPPPTILPHPRPILAPISIPPPFPGRCRCCTPFPCKKPKIFINARCRCECPRIRCPPGQTLNSVTCKCDCPKGSRKNSAGQCVGDCAKINLFFCRFVKCADNQHFQCKVERAKCVCPSCDDVRDTRQCMRTKCIEQRRKPRCKLDPCTRKCRCPRCEDQPDKAWCDRTQCGPNYHLQCKWNRYYQSCSCPH